MNIALNDSLLYAYLILLGDDYYYCFMSERKKSEKSGNFFFSPFIFIFSSFFSLIHRQHRINMNAPLVVDYDDDDDDDDDT